MKNKFKLIQLIIFILLIGCTKEPERITITQAPTPSQGIPEKATLTLTPTPTRTINPTSKSPEQEITPTPTPTIDPIESMLGYEKKCIPITESSLTKVSYPGKLLTREQTYYFTVDLTDHQSARLEVENVAVEDVDDISVDRKKLIASTFQLQDVFILDASGIIIDKVKYQDQWKIISWLDNENWLIHFRYPGNSFDVFDPIREKIVSSFSIDAIDAYYIASPPGQNLLLTMIDPTARLAIYFDHENGGRAILWDIQDHKTLSWLPIYVPPTSDEGDYYVSHLPLITDEWSPDGIQFTLAAPAIYTTTLTSPSEKEELFNIHSDGNIQQLTHFTDIFNYVHIERPKWSPDSLQLAFWLQTKKPNQVNDQGQYRLMIYDTESRKFTDYCLGSFGSWKEVFWSPSGKQLIVQTIIEETEVRTAFLLDFEKNIGLRFKYDPTIKNWLTDSP